LAFEGKEEVNSKGGKRGSVLVVRYLWGVRKAVDAGMCRNTTHLCDDMNVTLIIPRSTSNHTLVKIVRWQYSQYHDAMMRLRLRLALKEKDTSRRLSGLSRFSSFKIRK
jgi:hypothetical protein